MFVSLQHWGEKQTIKLQMVDSKAEEEKAKPKKTKSRTGCVTCKRRRLKCDEAKPYCQNCIKRGIVCGGYAVNFKWREFSESCGTLKKSKKTTEVKTIDGVREEQNSESHHTETTNLQKALEDATFSVTGKSAQEIAIANVLISKGKNPHLASEIANAISGISDFSDIDSLTQIHLKSLEEANRKHHKVQDKSIPQAAEIVSIPRTQDSQSADGNGNNTRSLSTPTIGSPLGDDPPKPLSTSKTSISSILTKDSPINLFKDVPSPQQYPRSPNITGMFLPYQQSIGEQHQIFTSLSNVNTPKFLEDMDPGQYMKFSPLNLETFAEMSPRYIVRSGNPLHSLSPSFSGELNMKHTDSSTSTISQAQTAPLTLLDSASPVFTGETPKFSNFSNPGSPFFSQLLNLPNSDEQTEEDKTEDKVLREVNDRTEQCYQLAHYTSPGSDIAGTPNNQTMFPHLSGQNIRSLHIADEHLTTLLAFDQHTCGIMSIKNGPTENPWRTYLLPMSQSHPVVRNALLAMTSFHIARGDSNIRARGMKYMKEAIVSLVHGLSSDNKDVTDKTPPDVALATCIALAMGEAWDRQTTTGIAHLKGAKSMIAKVLDKFEVKRPSRKRALSIGSSSSQYLEEMDSTKDLLPHSKRRMSRELQFLVNAWIYFDVLARMSSGEEYYNDEEVLFEEIRSTSPESEKNIDSPNLTMKRSKSGSFSSIKRMKLERKQKNKPDSAQIIKKYRSLNLEEGDLIDPLLGVAQTLFPIIDEVATLIGQVRSYKSQAGASPTDKSCKNCNPIKTPLRMISHTVELKSAIEHWKIPQIPHSGSFYSEDPNFDLNAAVATAEAYRYATLLYLHQTVPEVPSPTSHSLAENVMMLLASIPSSSRTLVTHMFPLFVASCEAKVGEEREWATERWNELTEKMWLGTINRAWEVVKEVWARKDSLKEKKRNKFVESDSNDQEESSQEYNKVKRRISVAIHGDDESHDDDIESFVGSWSHWTTVMKEWGWEILLA